MKDLKKNLPIWNNCFVQCRNRKNKSRRLICWDSSSLGSHKSLHKFYLIFLTPICPTPSLISSLSMEVLSKNSTKAEKGRDQVFGTILSSHDKDCDIFDFLCSKWEYDPGGVDFCCLYNSLSSPQKPLLINRPNQTLSTEFSTPSTSPSPGAPSSPTIHAPSPCTTLFTHQTIERCFTETFPHFSNQQI